MVHFCFFFFFDRQRYTTCAAYGTCVHAIQLFHETESNRISAQKKRRCGRVFLVIRLLYLYQMKPFSFSFSFVKQKRCTFALISVKVTQEEKKNYQRKSKQIQNVWWKSTQLFSTKKHSDPLTRKEVERQSFKIRWKPKNT